MSAPKLHPSEDRGRREQFNPSPRGPRTSYLDATGGVFVFLDLAHLARAALRALALRCSGVKRAALILPPFAPPLFPHATAFGFFSLIVSISYMPECRQRIKTELT